MIINDVYYNHQIIKGGQNGFMVIYLTVAMITKPQYEKQAKDVEK